MKLSVLKNKKAQAVTELAIFGSIILITFGSLLSYMQRQNDDQYVRMEAFRRALQKACTYTEDGTNGGGASVQYNLQENRRHVDLSGYYKKGTPQSFSASNNVYWAIDGPGVSSGDLILHRVNEDEMNIKLVDDTKKDDASQKVYKAIVTDQNGQQTTFSYSYDDPDGKIKAALDAGKGVYVQEGDPKTNTNSLFTDQRIKDEDKDKITNTRSSALQENITTVLPCKVLVDDDDYDPDNNTKIAEGDFWGVTQYLYRDSIDGQYKYSSKVADASVERGEIWETALPKTKK